MRAGSAGEATRADEHGLTATLAVVSFAMLIVSLDQYIVVIALPEIGRELAYSPQTLQAVVSAYAIASGGFLLLGGRASDLLGRRRVLMVGLALYCVASLLGGLASTPAQQLVGRVVQGLGGALVFPSTLAIINVGYPEGGERNRALSIWAGCGAAGLVVGVLLGGVLTSYLGWRAVFLINVPLAGVTLLAALRYIAADDRTAQSRSFDVPGALAVTAAVTLLVFSLITGPERGWLSAWVVASALAGSALGASFFAVERRSADPLVPPDMLRRPWLRLASSALADRAVAAFGLLRTRAPSALSTGTPFNVAYIDAAAMSVLLSRQRYDRTGPRRFRYVDLGVTKGFEADLDVDERGLIVRYEHLFERVRS